MKDFVRLPNHSGIPFSPVPNAIRADSPATNEALALVRKTDSDGLKLLIQKAEAVRKLWAAKTVLECANVLWCWYFLMKEDKEELARITTMEQGKSLTKARDEIDYVASFVHWFAGEARRIGGDMLTSVKASQKLVVLKQLIGVTTTATPWNFPSMTIARKAAPTLAIGCTMIVKPVPFTPLSVYASVVLVYGTGMPQDLLPVVSGSASEISHEFVTNPTVRRISFTGSTEVGAKIFIDSVTSIKKLSLELSGNALFIVSDDTDLDKAVEGVLAGKFHSSGQTHVCTNCVCVRSGIYGEFCRRLSEKVTALKLGNGLEEGVNQEPSIKKKAVEKVEQHIVNALAKGASCLTSGKRSALDGASFKPTVLSGITAHMTVVREEIFGPLCPVFRFETKVEVIVAANNTGHGSAAYLFTSDTTHQWYVGEALEYGMVGINTSLISNGVAPFDGVKCSGLGCEGSKYGADEYLELKYLCINVAE